jgi:predicted ATPase
VQLKNLTVSQLFGRNNHSIAFPTRPEDEEAEAAPSIVILHGPNGVGKTTLLRMLSGMMSLDFTVFRQVPFRTAELEFSTGQTLCVADNHRRPPGAPLEVSFDDQKVRLSRFQSGPAEEKDQAVVETFRQAFIDATDSIHFDLIDTHRSPAADIADDATQRESILVPDPSGRRIQRRLRRPPEAPLAHKVRTFIAEAQADYRSFFASSEPDLFPRIISRLTVEGSPTYETAELRKRLAQVHADVAVAQRFGLAVEPWDYEEVLKHLAGDHGGPGGQYALMVIGVYTEFLEQRAEERRLVADRLTLFEDVLASFFAGKRVRIDPRQGIRIETPDGERLTESQLSSGEYHLLYLMVTALITRRRGTVIAIDEPEMSMHIAWQRRLIRNLIACASNASPQFIFATHSPEVVADYQDALVLLEQSG